VALIPEGTAVTASEQTLEALAAGTPPARIGRYSFDADGWAWSEGLYAIHGFTHGEISPTSELMVAHQDPDDVAEARDAFKQALTAGTPYSSYHHLIDASKRRRTVLVVGEGRLDGEGGVESLQGYVVDLTDVVRTDGRAQVDAAIAGVAEHRAVIEQAKGILVLACGISVDEAFEVLRAHSQDRNIKLHELARRLVDAVASSRPAGDLVQQRVLAIVEC
jgi:hypothetical protein